MNQRKLLNISKGVLTWVPIISYLRRLQSRTGGTDNARYCYGVWLRHLVRLSHHGFDVRGAKVGELGPGDSIGCGIAAVLSGADSYVGLDAVPYSQRANLEHLLDELYELFKAQAPVPDQTELSRVRPNLSSYEFPREVVDLSDLEIRAQTLRSEIRNGLTNGPLLSYRAPWFSANEIAANSLDLIFSQSVMEYVFPIETTYQSLSRWVKPGGFCSNAIDFSAMYLSPYWNGHWEYSNWEWRLVRGCREFFLNREPMSSQVNCAKAADFEIIEIEAEAGSGGLPTSDLAPRYRSMSAEDLETRGALIVLRKIAKQ